MSWQAVFSFVKSDYAKLVPILALAFYVSAIPHLGNPYRLHIDEWVHIAHSNSLLRTGDVFYPNPFSGGGSSGVVSLLELGYHLPLGLFQALSGIPWVDVAGFLPSITFVVTVISVYILANGMGFGWEAALFTSLLPTGVGILGPGFLVPVAVGLMLTCLLFFLVFNHRTVWSYVTIGLTLAYAVILHAPSAILAAMTIAPFVLISLKGEPRHSLAVTLALGFPFLVTLPWTRDLIISEASSLLVQKQMPAYHTIGQLVQAYGYPVTALCLGGIFILAMKGDKKRYGLVLGLAVLAAMLAVFYSLHYGVPMLYLRGLLFATLLMGIVAGAGLHALRTSDALQLPGKWEATLKSRQGLVKATGVCLSVAIIGVTLGVAIADRQKARYYNMIDTTDYEAFVWMRDNVSLRYGKAILDPWKATAFTAVTEKFVYARIHVSPSARDDAVYAFLKNGSTDTEFLRKNEISLVYTRAYDYRNGQVFEYAVDNPDLLEVNKNIYVLKDMRDR
jgi:hypothetical protein